MNIGTDIFEVGDVYINFYCGEGKPVCLLVNPPSPSIDLRYFPYDWEAPSLADTRLLFNLVRMETPA